MAWFKHSLVPTVSITIKPFGNIICFRNLKRATDEALALFSNKETTKIVLVPSYAEIEQDYQAAVSKLFALTPNYQSVDDLVTEEQQLEFIKAFREVMRYNAQLQTLLSTIKTKHNWISSTSRTSPLSMLTYAVLLERPPRKKKYRC